MKKYLIVLLALVVVAFAHAQAFAQTEIQIRDEAIIRLRQIYRGQLNYAMRAPGSFYPPPTNLVALTMSAGKVRRSLLAKGILALPRMTLSML